MKTYIVKQKSIRKSEILQKEHIFSASRYSNIQINSKHDFLVNLINISKKSVALRNQKKYFNYVEIGSINTTTGSIEPTCKKSIEISADSVYQLQKEDILISTVRTYLGGIGIVGQEDQDLVASKALVVLRELKKNIDRYYLFGILRTKFFIEQTNLILNASMYPRMDKDSFKKLKIPFPTAANNPFPEKVEEVISLTVQNIIDKEEQIKLKNRQIDKLIEKELKENQKAGSFNYSYPRIGEIQKKDFRIDSGLYVPEFKIIDNLIRNYKYGANTLVDKNFDVARGQNLQISCVGESFYSDKRKNNKFYTLVLSSNISEESTLTGKKYLGNTKNLKTIKDEDVIFCSRGAQFGRVAIFPKIDKKCITNIDNMHISNNNAKLEEKIFICQFIRYLRKIKHLYKIAIWGNGSISFTKYQLLDFRFPNFPESKQNEIAKLFYNPLYKNTDLTLGNYLKKEKTRNKDVGIFQLNSEIFDLREQLENLVHKIVTESPMEIGLNY